MKKIVVMLLAYGTFLWANMPLNEGLYISDGCHVSFEIRDSLGKNLYYRTLSSKDYKIEISEDLEHKKYLSFTGLYSVNQETKEKIKHTAALVNDKDTFTIQNEGNSMNPYITFEQCDKYIKYHKVDSVNMIEKIFKKSKNLKKYNESFIYTLLNKFPIKANNLESYNNIAYYLQKEGQNNSALAILHKVLFYYPSRMVAHYNYAENVEAILKKEKQSDYKYKDMHKHYLSYIALMIERKNDKKIPTRLKNKYSQYFSLLKGLSKKLKEKYQLLDVELGDINKDGLDDLSLVVELIDTDKIASSREFQMRPSNTNKRIWFIYLKRGNSYELFRKNTKLIESDEYTNCDDNFDDIEIKENAFYLNTHFWCSMGGWEMGRERYQFIYRDNELIIAGIEYSNTHRASGSGYTKSTNYLTKRIKIQETKDMGEPNGKVKWEKVKRSTPIKFEEF